MACNTLPCMAPRRVILVKNFHKYSPKEQEVFFPYVASPSVTTSLILLAEGTPATFLKGVRSGAFHLQRPPEGTIPQWINNIAAEFGKQISPEAVEHLCQSIGTDLQGIHNELFKVSLYVGEKTQIELQDVVDVVSELRPATLFELTGAISEKDLKRALQTLAKIWESGEQHLRIMGMIARQLRHLLVAKESMARGEGQQDLRKHLGISNSQYLSALCVQARRYSHESLKTALLALWETDIRLKTSPLPKRLLLEDVLIRLCADRHRRHA